MDFAGLKIDPYGNAPGCDGNPYFRLRAHPPSFTMQAKCVWFMNDGNGHRAGRVMKQQNKRRMIMISDVGSHAFREACLGAAEYAADKGGLDFSVQRILDTDTIAHLRADDRRANGLLLHSNCFALIEGQLRLRTPRVYYLGNDPPRPAPVVGIDNIAIGRMAAEHLLERSYRSLAFVGCPSSILSRLRGQGFNQVAQERGIVVHRHELPLTMAPTPSAFLDVKMGDALHRFIKALPNPCGLFAINDVIAFFLIETARFCGLTVPEQVGIIGVDDDPVANASSKLGISSVQAPFREVGRRAAEALHRLMLGKPCPQRQRLPPTRVVVRASTDTFMTDDPLLRRAQHYIEANRQRHVRVADVVRALATTEVTLRHRFAQHLGTAPADYILRRRIEYAKDLLRGVKLNVGEVSETCAFSCCSYFCRVFKSVTGVSPTSFLKGPASAGASAAATAGIFEPCRNSLAFHAVK